MLRPGAVNLSLLLLALRRALHPALIAATLLVAAAAARSERASGWTGGWSETGAAAGVARAGVWTLGALLLAPALLAVAAHASGRWRGGEAEWLAPRALGPGAVLVSTWLGGLLGALALALAPLVAGELAAGGAAPAWRAAGELALRSPEPLEDGAGLRWRLADPRAPAGSRVRFELQLSGGQGPAADVRARARRLRGGEEVGERSVERRLARAGTLDLSLPPGPGELELSLARIGDGATLALQRPAVRLLVPAGGPGMAGAVLLAHLLLALGAGTALALALGRWMGPGTAAGVLLGGWAAATLAPSGAPAALPGLSLPAALRELRAGFVPAAPSLAAWLGALGAAALGLGLARLGLRNWRAER